MNIVQSFNEGTVLFNKQNYQEALNKFNYCLNKVNKKISQEFKQYLLHINFTSQMFKESLIQNCGVCCEKLNDYTQSYELYKQLTNYTYTFNLIRKCFIESSNIDYNISFFNRIFNENNKNKDVQNKLINLLISISEETHNVSYLQLSLTTLQNFIGINHINHKKELSFEVKEQYGNIYITAGKFKEAYLFLKDIYEHNVNRREDAGFMSKYLTCKLISCPQPSSFLTECQIDHYLIDDVRVCWYTTNDNFNPLGKKLSLKLNTNKSKEYGYKFTTDYMDNQILSRTIKPCGGKFMEKESLLVELKDIKSFMYSLYDDKKRTIYMGQFGYTQSKLMFNNGTQTKNINLDVFSALHINVKNYYHWMIMSLSRIVRRLKDIKDMKDMKEYILIPKTDSSFINDSIKMLQIPEDKIIYVDLNQEYHFKSVKMIDYKSLPEDPYINDMMYIYSPSKEDIRILHEEIKLKEDVHTRDKIIYVRRSTGTRSINDDSNLLKLFKSKFGSKFIVFENGSLDYQRTLFTSAKVIFGPHGAGLSNQLFCSKGTHVFEFLLNPNCNVCFEYMADALEHIYHPINYITSYYYGEYDNITEEKLDMFMNEVNDSYMS